jgi:ribosomal protein S18 acetylase RimI-like enzyme
MSTSSTQRPSIRRAVSGDAAALALVGAATLLETYTELVQGPDLIAHARNKHAETLYAAWITDPDVCIWIAETQTAAPAGYLVLIPATLPIGSPEPGDVEVLRIYVLSRYQHTGLGHALMQHAIAEARARAAPRLILGVNKDNTKALAFYARQGFKTIGRRDFPVGNAIFDDLVVSLNLQKE